MLQFVGQPIIDVGVATIMAFNKRDLPEQVTKEDLDRIVEYMLAHYMRQPLKSFLASAIFTINAGYFNPTMGQETRKSEIERCLRSYTLTTTLPSEICVFCGHPACDVVYRQHIALTAAERMINFGSGGRPGLHVCGGCLLASQAFPLGCTVKCAGRALLVHSDNPALTLAFASAFLRENRRILGLMNAEDTKISYPRTIVVSQLVKIQKDQQSYREDWGSLTAYHLTNYGANPDVKIMHLPSQAIDFLRTVESDKYSQIWQAIVARAWAQPKEAKKGKAKIDVDGEQATHVSAEQPRAVEPLGARRNSLYEDLFDLFARPQHSRRFVRRYFLGQYEVPDSTSPTSGRKPALWDLTTVFLRKVLQMEQYRIDAIREVGDRLATAITENDDRKLLISLFKAHNYGTLRTVLVKANREQVKVGAAPLISFGEFVTIFQEGVDLPYTDWSLARDLIYIRVLDRLYEQSIVMAQEALIEIEQTGDEQSEQESEMV